MTSTPPTPDHAPAQRSAGSALPQPVDDPTVAFDPIDAPTWFGGEPLPTFAPPDTTVVAATGMVRPTPFPRAPVFEPRHHALVTEATPVPREYSVRRRVLVGLGALGLVGCGFAASSLLHAGAPAAPAIPPLAADASSAALAVPPPTDAVPALPAPALPSSSAVPAPRTTQRAAATTRRVRPAVPPAAPPAPVAAPPAAPAGYVAYQPGYAPAPEQQAQQPQAAAPQHTKAHPGGLIGLLGG